MALLAESRMHSFFSADRVASAMAAVLGVSGALMFYYAYAGSSELALPASAGLMLASLVAGAQGYKRKREVKIHHGSTATMMRAIDDTLAEYVVVRDLNGKLVFTNAAARALGMDGTDAAAANLLAGADSHGQGCTPVFQSAPTEAAGRARVRLPWRDTNGSLLGWVEIGAAVQAAAPPAQRSNGEPEAQRDQRTESVRELLAHVEISHEEERKAIARKLHGELGSSLAALSMHMAMLSKHLPGDLVFRERMQQIKDLINSSAATARSIQSALRPDKLDVFGLKAAAEDLVQQISCATGIQCELHFPDKKNSYPAPIEIAVYRMLEEALSNIARHAYATHVDIMVEEDEKEIKLSVRDNGVGFSPANLPAGVYGLRHMRERAAYLGGSLLIRSAPGKGASLEIRLPRQVAVPVREE